jgi:PadR family transcriptional regulator, regulatory protein PadR
MSKRMYTLSTLLVLRALMDGQPDEHYGLQLIAATGVKAGAMYPILSRLEADGAVVSRWEEIDESVEMRRRRRYYRLTTSGEDIARAALTEFTNRLEPPPQRPTTRKGWAPS